MARRRSRLLTALACGLVWAVLALPDEVAELTPGALLRIPLEGLLLVGLLLALPARWRRRVAAVLGLALAWVVLLKGLDLGFSAVLDRPFHELDDWANLGPGYAVLRAWVGPTWAVVTVVVLVLVVLAAVLLLLPATLRVERAVSARPVVTARVAGAAAAVWALAAVTGLQTSSGPVASASTARLVGDHATTLVTDPRAERAFARALAEDPLPVDAGTLAALRGKDVLVISVESYGRAALTQPDVAPEVVAALDEGTRRLEAVGVAARSGYLTSPTYGGSSWLAHGTLQSGLWTDDQARYEQLLASDRQTLTSIFGQAGWHTLFVLPSVRGDWPEGQRFYRYDTLLSAPDLGYRGPRLGWGGIPDQYTLAELRRSVLDETDREPVMAEVDLVTSHHPWSVPPPLVVQDAMGDGSVLACMPGCGRDPTEVAGLGHLRERYADTVAYTLSAVARFVGERPDPDLVVVLLGDHQPWSSISGRGAGHDVPVAIVTADPEVLRRTDAWGWTEGLRPAPDAPVWRMDAFRDRFLSAFGPDG